MWMRLREVVSLGIVVARCAAQAIRQVRGRSEDYNTPAVSKSVPRPSCARAVLQESTVKKLINDVQQVVPDALRGLAALNPAIALTGNDHIAVRSDVAAMLARGEVALLSGGGAGHEPAHAGY